jgi:proline dehydrogenase
MLRSTLLKLSESNGFAHWVTSNPTTRGMARRFVAGETLDEAIIAARACNSMGMYTSLDYLGENVSTVDDAQRARDAYIEIFDRIARERLHANVSCKLTQLGLDLSADFCEGLVLSIAERAAGYDNFLRVDMENSAYTQRTIDLVKRVRERNPAIGTVIVSQREGCAGLAFGRLPHSPLQRRLQRAG